MKKKFQICTVIYGKTLRAFLKNLKKAQASSTMVELRVDSIKDFNSDDLLILKDNLKVPSIFTFRHKKEGGMFGGSVLKQQEIIKESFASGFAYVDVAYDNPVAEDLTTKEKKQLLLSYHNQEETPSFQELQDIVHQMRSAHPAIIKIATFINNAKDIPVLATFLEQKGKSEKLIVIGMGEKGEITRALFPLMGSCIAYVASKGGNNIAPGILTEADLLKKYQALSNNKKGITS